MGDNYYLLSTLPGLGDFGSEMPLSPGELRELASVGRGTAALVDTVLLGDDLLQLQAFLAGEIREVEPNVLDPAQARGDAALPDYLQVEEQLAGGGPVAGVDRLWDAYYRHAADVAGRYRSDFLRAWVGYELALRNAVARARAKALELDATGYLVATDLASEDEDFGRLLTEWQSADTPLAGLETLDRARWQWLADHDAYFTFSNDELGAYAAKLMLLVRWRRVHQAQRRDAQGEGIDGGPQAGERMKP